MCGFVGFSGHLGYKREVLNNMMDLIVHRGPNSAGEYTDADMALGFRRLSIIDLADGSQPMFNEDRSLVAVYNGEIYNFPQLKKELEDAGHVLPPAAIPRCCCMAMNSGDGRWSGAFAVCSPL